MTVLPKEIPGLSPKDQQEIMGSTRALIGDIEDLKIVDAASYARADAMLGMVRTARKLIEQKMDTILKPAKEALDAARAVKNLMDKPLGTGEVLVRGKMMSYAREQQEREEEKRRAAEAEASKLRAEADKKRQQEEAAKTDKMRERLATARRELEKQAELVQAVPVVAPVKVAGSSTRIVDVWELTDMVALIRAAADPKSNVPEDVFQINTVLVNKFFKMDPETVKGWPGITVKKEVRIVGASIKLGAEE